MYSFLRTNKTVFTYALVFLLVIPTFGFKFLLGLIGNILLLFILVPLLILIIIFLNFNSFKTKVKNCNQCGSLSIGINNTCMSCGADLGNKNDKEDLINNPCEKTIEIQAEEII